MLVFMVDIRMFVIKELTRKLYCKSFIIWRIIYVCNIRCYLRQRLRQHTKEILRIMRHACFYSPQYTGCTQKNGAVSKVNKKFISHLTRAQRTPSAAATVQVSHALPAFRFSCLLRGQFPRLRRSRKRLSVCSVLRCPHL